MFKFIKNNISGIDLLGLLGIVYVILKLCGVIAWSWWLVTLPFWGGLVAVLVGVVMGFIAAGYILVKESQREK